MFFHDNKVDAYKAIKDFAQQFEENPKIEESKHGTWFQWRGDIVGTDLEIEAIADARDESPFDVGVTIRRYSRYDDYSEVIAEIDCQHDWAAHACKHIVDEIEADNAN